MGPRTTTDSLAFRRALRRTTTDAEQRLWALLRDRRLGLKFRRQHSVGPYVLDFFCASRRVAIELDGGQHFEPGEIERDARRTAYLARKGIRVVRFTDREMLLETEGVLATIWVAVNDEQPPSP